MSACAGLGIDNLYVDITAEEVPILDGSSASFVFLLQSAGIELQKAPRRFIRLKQPVEVREGTGASAKWARLEPFHGFKLSFEIDFDHPAVDSTGQRVEFDMGSGQLQPRHCPCPHLRLHRDVEMMRSNGLALGGGLDNAIVMDDYKVLNAGGLRYDDEFVKHKILDAMGDLYLLGKPLLAAYSAFRSGHAMNNVLLRELLAQQDAWEVVTFDDERQAPAALRKRCEPGKATCPDCPRGRLAAVARCCSAVSRIYAATGQVRYRRYGLVIVKWTVIAGLAFFAVLFVIRIL